MLTSAILESSLQLVSIDTGTSTEHHFWDTSGQAARQVGIKPYPPCPQNPHTSEPALAPGLQGPQSHPWQASTSPGKPLALGPSTIRPTPALEPPSLRIQPHSPASQHLFLDTLDSTDSCVKNRPHTSRPSNRFETPSPATTHPRAWLHPSMD